MFTKIIVGHDLHSSGDDAIALGSKLAEATHAELVVAGVWRDEEEKVAARIQAIAAEADAVAEAFPASSPARGLHGLAEEIGADLIVVGSSRHGKLGQVLAGGNVGARLLHGSPCAVAIAPRGYREDLAEPLDTLVLGVDGSEESKLALEDAVELARKANARLKLVAVAELSPVAYGKGRGQAGWNELFETIEEKARNHLDEAVSSIPHDVAAEGSLVSGEPAVKLADAGQARGTLLMLGSRAYGPVRGVLVGSVSEALVNAAPCPVVVHPRGARVDAASPASPPAMTRP